VTEQPPLAKENAGSWRYHLEKVVLLHGFTLADFQQLSRLVSIVLNTESKYPLLM
jgi:hypothetical protein